MILTKLEYLRRFTSQERVTIRREAVAVAAANEAVTVSSKSAAAVVTLDQEEITINRRN